jgi:hypothetical protein
MVYPLIPLLAKCIPVTQSLSEGKILKRCGIEKKGREKKKAKKGGRDCKAGRGSKGKRGEGGIGSEKGSGRKRRERGPQGIEILDGLICADP